MGAVAADLLYRNLQDRNEGDSGYKNAAAFVSRFISVEIERIYFVKNNRCGFELFCPSNGLRSNTQKLISSKANFFS